MHERPEYSRPITELQFTEQQDVMEWMAEQILASVTYVEAGEDLDELLDRLSRELHVRRDDLYYGVQYAKDLKTLLVNGNRVHKIIDE